MGQQGGCDGAVAGVEVLEQEIDGLSWNVAQQHPLGSGRVLLLHPKPTVMHLGNEWMVKERGNNVKVNKTNKLK